MKAEKSEVSLNFIVREVAIYDRSASSSAFVETFIWEPGGADEKSLGSLFIIGQIYSPKGKRGNAELVATLASAIKDEYYRNPSREAERSFGSALKKAEAILKSSSGIVLIAAVLAERKFSLARLGEGECFLLRNGVLHRIDMSPSRLSDRAGSYFQTITRGEIMANDTLILSTPQIRKLSPSRTVDLALEGKLDKFVLEHKEEFRNLGLITIKLKGVMAELAERRAPSSFLISAAKESISRLSLFIHKKLLKRTVTLALLVVLVFVLTIAALFSQKRADSARARADELVAHMADLENRTLALVELDNYREAESSLKEWENELNELASLEIAKQEYSRIKIEFEAAKARVKRYETARARLAIDLTANSVGFSPNELSGDENAIFLLGDNVFYRFSLAGESGGFTVLPPLESGDFHGRDLSMLSSDPQEIIILGERSIGRYTGEFAIFASDPLLAEVKKMSPFKNSLYLLGGSSIWQLDLETVSLGEWTRGKFFKNAKDFAIDGFIYVLEEGKIQKLLSGSRHSEIAIESGVERIFTSASIENMYLLSPKEGTIIIMDKLGNVLKRLRHENLLDSRDIIVARDEKTLWFLNGQKVFSISL